MHAKNPYQAYRKATHTVSKTRQVVMLYEGILRNLQQARDAIVNRQIETRYRKLLRASEIVVGLQMSLDFNQGQEAAQALYDFYAMLDKRIIKLQRTNDTALCDELIAEVRSMHEVWHKIDRGEVDESSENSAAIMQQHPHKGVSGHSVMYGASPDAPASSSSGSTPTPQSSSQNLTISA